VSDEPHNTVDERQEEHLAEGTLLSHLIELRSRLIKISIAVVGMFVILLPFSQKIFVAVSKPLVDVLPGQKMIATAVASPLLTPFKLTFFVALFVAMPVVLYQIWSFVAPGLYKREKRFAFPLLGSSIILFYSGIAFAYFVVFELVFGFFASVTPQSVEMMTDIAAYLDFITKIFLAFGLAFEVPIATVLVVWTGLTTPEKLGKARPYVFLMAFIIGMFLTPPDVISQTLLAVPVYLLYELGILMSKLFVRQRSRKPDEAVAAED
jgi:sec-independent protein translocase protein TatC